MPASSSIQSKINRLKGQIKQLQNNTLFNDDDRDRLLPIYQMQLDDLELQIKQDSQDD